MSSRLREDLRYKLTQAANRTGPTFGTMFAQYWVESIVSYLDDYVAFTGSGKKVDYILTLSDKDSECDRFILELKNMIGLFSGDPDFANVLQYTLNNLVGE